MSEHELHTENEALHRLLADAAATLLLIAEGELPSFAARQCLERISSNDPQR
jgi:hypothetical protein